MIISLIGMSNCGKTYWSKKLEFIGFKRFGCDDMIEKKLESELKKLGYTGINDVAKWMGQPYEIQYPKTSKKYLEFEKETLEEIIKELFTIDKQNDTVIDTTGSVIYHGEKIIKELQKLTKIVLLDTPESVLQEMFSSYIRNPKPVYWGKNFDKKENETPKAALFRCYPKLLHFRQSKYRQYANIILDYPLTRKYGLDPVGFLKLILGN